MLLEYVRCENFNNHRGPAATRDNRPPLRTKRSRPPTESIRSRTGELRTTATGTLKSDSILEPPTWGKPPFRFQAISPREFRNKTGYPTAYPQSHLEKPMCTNCGRFRTKTTSEQVSITPFLQEQQATQPTQRATFPPRLSRSFRQPRET